MEIDACCWVQLYSESFEFNNVKHRYIKSHAKQMHTHRWGVKMIISIGLPIFYSKLYILKLDYFSISFEKYTF